MTHQVKLSKESIEILKLFSSINGSMAFKAGNIQRTLSAGEGVFAEATLPEEFSIPFSIYELNKFLGVLNLPQMKDATLEFNDDKKVVIKGQANTKINYFFTNQSFVTAPEKAMKLPSVELDVTLSSETLDGFMRAASALGHTIMAFKVEAGQAYLTATNPELGDASNDYQVDLGEVVDAQDGIYRVKIANVKILPGNYRVNVCARGMIQFEAIDRQLKVYVGLETV